MSIPKSFELLLRGSARSRRFPADLSSVVSRTRVPSSSSTGSTARPWPCGASEPRARTHRWAEVTMFNRADSEGAVIAPHSSPSTTAYVGSAATPPPHALFAAPLPMTSSDAGTIRPSRPPTGKGTAVPARDSSPRLLVYETMLPRPRDSLTVGVHFQLRVDTRDVIADRVLRKK